MNFDNINKAVLTIFDNLDGDEKSEDLSNR